MTRKVQYRTCELCDAMCGLRVEVDGQDILSVRGDKEDAISRGHRCSKAPHLGEFHHDPDRLHKPLRRDGDEWREISWKEASAEVAKRIRETQAAHDHDSVGIYFGKPLFEDLESLAYGRHLLDSLQTKNRFSTSSIDQLPQMLSGYLMLGHPHLFRIPDLDRTQYLLMLGNDPLISDGSFAYFPNVRERLQAIQNRGGKVVVIDSHRSESAKLADEHFFIRPGTEAILLLGVLKVLLERKARLGHLQDLVQNLDRAQALVKQFSLQICEAFTGVPANIVRRIAHEFRNAPMSVCHVTTSASSQEFGALCAWLTDLINIVTANFDTPGGAMFTQPPLDMVQGVKGFKLDEGGFGRWKSRVRGLPEFCGELPVSTLSEEIISEGPGQIKALISVGGNPVLSTPNAKQLERALHKLDFMVCISPYLNETTSHAHLILPPASPLERSRYELLRSLRAPRNNAKFSEALLKPLTESKSEGQIMAEITLALEEAQHGKWSQELTLLRGLKALGVERLLDAGLRMGSYGRGLVGLKRGLSLATLRKHPHGIDLGPLTPVLPTRLPKEHRFIEAAPGPIVGDLNRLKDRLAEIHAPNHESLLLVARGSLSATESWLHNCEPLADELEPCTLWVHPNDAEQHSLKEGKLVHLRSEIGEVSLHVHITEDIMPGVVSMPYGFGHDRPGLKLRIAKARAGANLNDLSNDIFIDQLSGTPALSGIAVRIELLSEDTHQAAE